MRSTFAPPEYRGIAALAAVDALLAEPLPAPARTFLDDTEHPDVLECDDCKVTSPVLVTLEWDGYDLTAHWVCPMPGCQHENSERRDTDPDPDYAHDTRHDS